MLALRPYQRECLERLRARYREGKRRLLVSLPTGTGKTVVFAHLPSFFGMKRRLLVLALPDGEWATVHEDHLNQWVITFHSRREPPLPGKPLVRATLPEAIEAVDEIVAGARREAVMIIDLDAEWRERPASEKQLWALEQRRIPRPAGLTRGQASWIISMSAAAPPVERVPRA